MPASPPSIFTPPTGSSPSAPPEVFAPVGGGGAPDAPPAVFSAPGGSSPTAPPEVFTPVTWTPNYLETDQTGANNDLRFEQVNPAVIPTIRYTGTTFPPSTVSVAGNDITLTIHTLSGITASAAMALFEASTAASALVTVSLKTGNNGSGLIGVTDLFGPTALSGGDAITAPPEVFTPAGGGGAPDAPPEVFSAPSGSSPTAPPEVFSPVGGGGAPDAPGGVFTPILGGTPDAPPPIFGIHEDAVLAESGEEIPTEGNNDYIAQEA